MIHATPLDAAFDRMEEAPEADAPRLAFYGQIVATELFLLLEREPQEAAIDPVVFDVEQGRFVAAFDSEERLALFAGQPSPYAALPGGRVVALLSDQRLGLALNLDVAPSSILLPGQVIEWIAQTQSQMPAVIAERPVEFRPPNQVAEDLIVALDRRLARATGLADRAYLVGVLYRSGQEGHLVVFVGAEPDAETALASAIGQALTFSGLDLASLDIAFVRIDDRIVPLLEKVGLGFDLTIPQPVRSAPGTDPKTPPRLR